MRVLAIDDEKTLLRCLQLTLSEKHHEVETAASASAAFALLAGARFDVIICDLHMPGMNGRAFAERLSPTDASHVIFTTGGAYEDGDSDFLDSHRVLMKPFSTAGLLHAIDALSQDAAA